eukprot:CAMPEP_0202889216 /NCGR_PEP_ID=MMETSP1391-20130828/43591_1 /ASSEMBLY_ACC=CAM_ASM_000867 /TAXON_ID=1034604 /ORGANISM="Chlamydomonas leiostraca, Strain SAG 11-49" /LENGTH=144 /DNA_ID=CAMNT_0049572539 /DNA_START=936 /DNA_END=1371 /DNA_ORIENTATION=-
MCLRQPSLQGLHGTGSRYEVARGMVQPHTALPVNRHSHNLQPQAPEQYACWWCLPLHQVLDGMAAACALCCHSRQWHDLSPGGTRCGRRGGVSWCKAGGAGRLGRAGRGTGRKVEVARKLHCLTQLMPQQHFGQSAAKHELITA